LPASKDLAPIKTAQPKLIISEKMSPLIISLSQLISMPQRKSAVCSSLIRLGKSSINLIKWNNSQTTDIQAISKHMYLRKRAEGMNNSILLRFQCNILLLPIEIVALFQTVSKINQFLLKITWKLKSMIAKLTVEEAD
jgi:hypothetical protein